MKNQQRSIRRHHRNRLKKKRKNYWGDRLEENSKHLVIDTPTPCSCFMCGNPRKHWNESTRQEKSADIEFKDTLQNSTHF